MITVHNQKAVVKTVVNIPIYDAEATANEIHMNLTENKGA